MSKRGIVYYLQQALPGFPPGYLFRQDNTHSKRISKWLMEAGDAWAHVVPEADWMLDKAVEQWFLIPGRTAAEADEWIKQEMRKP